MLCLRLNIKRRVHDSPIPARIWIRKISFTFALFHFPSLSPSPTSSLTMMVSSESKRSLYKDFRRWRWGGFRRCRCRPSRYILRCCWEPDEFHLPSMGKTTGKKAFHPEKKVQESWGVIHHKRKWLFQTGFLHLLLHMLWEKGLQVTISHGRENLPLNWSVMSYFSSNGLIKSICITQHWISNQQRESYLKFLREFDHVVSNSL